MFVVGFLINEVEITNATYFKSEEEATAKLLKMASEFYDRGSCIPETLKLIEFDGFNRVVSMKGLVMYSDENVGFTLKTPIEI